MPFQIVRNNIVRMETDAIVNTAFPLPEVGSGVDAAIHAAAGPQLLSARQEIGTIRPGSAAITPGFGLPARYVIHAVGPVWRSGLLGEARLLRRCYRSALALAAEHGCKSIAFPLISAGNCGFPRDKALEIALSSFREFLSEQEMEITLVVFDRDAVQLSRDLSLRVRTYIDQHYVDRKIREEYDSFGMESRRWEAYDSLMLDSAPRESDAPKDSGQQFAAEPNSAFPAAKPAWESSAKKKEAARSPFSAPRPKRTEAASKKSAISLDQLLKQMDAGFSETLLTLIDRTGKKDSEIYARANISRQHFSKIRNNPNYKPTKATALAFAVALELDLAQTRDLIGRAGYALTNSSVFDVIIMYFIGQGIFDLYTINLALFEHDQTLLGQ